MKITFTAQTSVEIPDEAREYILKQYREIRAHGSYMSGYYSCYHDAASKLPDDASDEMILNTIVGERFASMIADLAPYFPWHSRGVQFKVSTVAYQETPAPRALPADAKPQVVEVKKS